MKLFAIFSFPKEFSFLNHKFLYVPNTYKFKLLFLQFNSFLYEFKTNFRRWTHYQIMKNIYSTFIIIFILCVHYTSFLQETVKRSNQGYDISDFIEPLSHVCCNFAPVVIKWLNYIQSSFPRCILLSFHWCFSRKLFDISSTPFQWMIYDTRAVIYMKI